MRAVSEFSASFFDATFVPALEVGAEAGVGEGVAGLAEGLGAFGQAKGASFFTRVPRGEVLARA